MNYDKRLIGIRIMQKRKEKGLTQEMLAESIGLSKNHLSNIERGLNLPTTKTILNLCNMLGCTPDYYLIGQIVPDGDNDVVSLISKCPPQQQKLIKDFIEIYLRSL